jgi:hypothetical protein
MIERKQKPRTQCQLPRERLAFLLAQLSELDPDSDERPQPIPAPKLEPKLVPKPEPKPRLETRPIAEPEPVAGSFHSLLGEYATRQDEARANPWGVSFNFRPWLGLTQKRALGGLTRAWSWLHSKYHYTATKRMRVSETVSLGEKRFLALVNIEGREFLIGGAASNVSMLAQLEKNLEPAEAPRLEFGVKGSSR